MSIAEQMWNCVPTTLERFKAEVLALRHAFVEENVTSAGRLLIVRAGDARGPLIGYREDYLHNEAQFYVRPK